MPGWDRWTPAEKEKFRRLAPRSTVNKLAKIFDRTPLAITHQAGTLRILCKGMTATKARALCFKPKPKLTLRTCLGGETPHKFMSWGPGNRLCKLHRKNTGGDYSVSLPRGVVV